MADEHGNGNGSQADARLRSMRWCNTQGFFIRESECAALAWPQEKPPNISIQVNVNARQVAETDFEVNILLEGSQAKARVSCSNSSLTTRSVPAAEHSPSDMHPIVMIECPRCCFPSRAKLSPRPSARWLSALYIDPIDFARFTQASH